MLSMISEQNNFEPKRQKFSSPLLSNSALQNKLKFGIVKFNIKTQYSNNANYLLCIYLVCGLRRNWFPEMKDQYLLFGQYNSENIP